jgi:hypothetical protein
MCLWIYQRGRLPLSFEQPLIYKYIEQRTVVFNFLHHHNFRSDIRILLFGDSRKDQAQFQNILLPKVVYRHSLMNSRRFTEGT